MATNKQTIEVDVLLSGNVSESLGQLRRQLLDLKKIDLDIIGPEKAKQVVNRMAEIKGKMDDMNMTLKNFDPKDTFGNLASSLRPVATGFAVLTQSQILFGAENKKLEELQKRLTTAITIGMALQELADANRLKALYAWLLAKPKELIISGLELVMKKANVVATNQEAAGTLRVAVAKKVATAAQWLWNAAMAANPIFLFITAVAALGTGIYLLSKAFKKSGEDMKVNAEAVKNLKEKQKDYLRTIQEARLQHLKNIGKITDREVQIEMLKLDTIAKMNAVRDKMREDIAKNPKNIKTLTRLADEEVKLIQKAHAAQYLVLITAKKEEKKVNNEANKEKLEADKKINEQILKNMKDGLDKELATLKNKYDEEKKLVKGTKAQQSLQLLLIEEGYQKDKEKIIVEYIKKELEYQRERQKEIEQKEKEIKEGQLDNIDELTNKRIESNKKELESDKEKYDKKLELANKFFDDIGNIESQLEDILTKALLGDEDSIGLLGKLIELTPELQAGVGEIIGEISKGTTDLLMDSISQATQAQIASLNQEVDNFQTKQEKALQALRDNNLITEAEYNSRKEQLDKQVEAKRKAAKRKAFELEKEENLKKVGIATALAVIKAIAASPETFGLPFSAFATAEGLIQAGFIKAQKPPAYAKGHLFNDETYYRNSIVGEAGPEALMSNRATEKYINLLSSLNTSVGGNSFGNNNNINELNLLNIQLERLINLTSNQKIVLPVQSLNQVQKDLTRLEATATLK